MNLMRKTNFMLMLILPSCLLQLSCGHDLTRRTAAKMINEKYDYPMAVTAAIRIHDASLCGDNFLWDNKTLELYQKAGLIRIENLKVSYPASSRPLRLAEFVVKLTPEGSRYLVKEDSSYTYVKLCSEELVEVTGIAFSGDKNQATVEFNTRCFDVTPFGKIGGVDEAKLEAHQVRMQLYDDGWRL